MSEYIKTKIQCSYQKELIQALEDIYGRGKIELYNTPKTLYDYMGRPRPEVANLIVRRHDVGSAANDLGFLMQDDGSYVMIWSQFDRRSKHVNPQVIVNNYVRHVVKNRYRGKYRISSANEEGIKLQVIGG